MTLKEKNTETMKTAMKSGDKSTTQYARTLLAAIRKKEIDDRKDATDEDVIRLVSTMLKQREESIQAFRSGGREDLAVQEEAEAVYLKQFLPEQLGDAELLALVQSVITEVGAKDAKDLGKVMKALLPKVQGRADGKRVTQVVKEKLGG